MKNKIKEEFDNIQISPNEKNKIYDNIMRKQKKKNFFWPVMGMSVAAIASFGLVLFNNFNPDKVLDKDQEVLESFNSLSIESNYSKEVLIKARTYLDANNIDLTNLKEGESTEIDATKIVDDEKYNTCNGKLIITKYASDYSYNTDVTCGTSTGKDIAFSIYEGQFLQNVYNVKDGIVLVSKVDVEQKSDKYGVFSSNLNFVLSDYDGKVKWQLKYKGLNNDEKYSDLFIKDFIELDDYYFAVIGKMTDININDNGYSYNSYNSYIKIDKKGNIIDEGELSDDAKVHYGNYIGSHSDKLYFFVYEQNGNNSSEGILEYSENGTKIINISNKLKGLGSFVNINELKLIDDYIYGCISVSEDYDKWDFYIYKMDLKGNLIWNKPVNYESKGTVHQINSLDDVLLISYQLSNSTKILKYSKDFEYLGEIDCKVDSDKNYFVNDISVKDNYLEINFVSEKSDSYTLFTDINGSVLNEVESSPNSEVIEYFDTTLLFKTNYVDSKIMQVYSTSKDALGNQVLVVSYK